MNSQAKWRQSLKEKNAFVSNLGIWSISYDREFAKVSLLSNSGVCKADIILFYEALKPRQHHHHGYPWRVIGTWKQCKHLLDYSRAAEIALCYGECSRSNEILARINIFLEFVLYLFMVNTVEAVEAFIGLQSSCWDCMLTPCVFALF